MSKERNFLGNNKLTNHFVGLFLESRGRKTVVAGGIDDVVHRRKLAVYHKGAFHSMNISYYNLLYNKINIKKGGESMSFLCLFEHKWEILREFSTEGNQRFAAEKCSEYLVERMLCGVTTILFQCRVCKKIWKEEILGK
ncbi:MAG: hypothetical protein KAS32_24765 [Candidatus Peribacteraceae bacterium]|nr:hypothetical protein [Candidatus Peribacteraceae bacterium]